MTSSVPFEIASTIQAASINRHPDPRYDLNPSTAASKKEPVQFSPTDDISDIDDEIPVSVLRPVPRRQTLPPLPDLRFEQSYLRSIAKTKDWTGVLFITIRDQVVMPLVQGTLWELGLTGMRFWWKSSASSGNSAGARLRHWLISNGLVRK